MRSIIIVTSWWSNILALTCLYRLLAFVPNREFYVMQVGKSEYQMGLFRKFLPESVTELIYPDKLLADDSVMREYLAKSVFAHQEGAWFFDHDTFLLEPSEQWFEMADDLFLNSHLCLCTRHPMPRCGVTQPAYWLSPLRWPAGLSSFNPVPFKPKAFSKRPDLIQHDGQLTLPEKDTLVLVREELESLGMTGIFPVDGDGLELNFLPSFPPHAHIGGLHLYTGPTQFPVGMPKAFYDWRRYTLMSFDALFKNCPSEWIAIEDPELLRRHEKMVNTLESE